MRAPWLDVGRPVLQGRLKIEMMRDLLSPTYGGLSLVSLDTDVMVVGDILAHFERFPEVRRRAWRGWDADRYKSPLQSGPPKRGAGRARTRRASPGWAQADALMSTDVLHSTIDAGDDGLERADKAMEWGIPVNMGERGTWGQQARRTRPCSGASSLLLCVCVDGMGHRKCHAARISSRERCGQQTHPSQARRVAVKRGIRVPPRGPCHCRQRICEIARADRPSAHPPSHTPQD